jgi:hypothetical protein
MQHVLSAQTLLPLQVVVQLPQWLLSVWVLTQVPLQQVRPEQQSESLVQLLPPGMQQVLLAQTWLPLQGVVQFPQ